MVRFILYLLRWQASGFVLAPVLALFTGAPLYDNKVILATIVANLIGGSVFFWIDRLIFRKEK